MINRDIFAIEVALLRVINSDHKLPAIAAYRLVKTHRKVSSEADIMRSSLKTFIEFEGKFMEAIKHKDNSAAKLLESQYSDTIRDANMFLGMPFDGDIPTIPIRTMCSSDGEWIDLPAGVINALEPILTE